MAAVVLTGLLAAAWLTVRRAPDAPISHLLHAWLIDRPARQLLRVERRHLIFLVVALLSAQALMSIGVADLGLAVAWDVSTYVDLLLVSWTLAATTNLKAVGRMTAARWWLLTGSIRRAGPHPRSKRPPRRPTPKPSANDDDRPVARAA